MARTKQTARLSSGGKGLGKAVNHSKAARKAYISGIDDDDEDVDVYQKPVTVGSISAYPVQQKKEKKKLSINPYAMATIPAAAAALGTSGSTAPATAEDKIPERDPLSFNVNYDSEFYAHYFHTGEQSTKICEPRFALARTPRWDPQTATYLPLSSELDGEYWVSTNFNSKYDGAGIFLEDGRPDLNLVIVLDISGSMGCEFRSSKDSGSSSKQAQTKLCVAKESILALLTHLRPNDRFGFVIFDTASQVVVPLSSWSDLDQVDLEKTIMRLRPCGGTNLHVGLEAATDLFLNFKIDAAASSAATTSSSSSSSSSPSSSSSSGNSPKQYSNRVFFLTDLESFHADEVKFSSNVEKNSQHHSIYTTVIGIDADLSRETIAHTSRTPGCNYSSVITSDGFREMLQHEFVYSVTPIAFNVKMAMSSQLPLPAAAADPSALSWDILQGYGSPEVQAVSKSTPIQISTEFPSSKNIEGDTRGGVLLFRLGLANLDKLSTEQRHDLSLLPVLGFSSQWENLQGVVQKHTQQLSFPQDALANSMKPAQSTDAQEESSPMDVDVPSTAADAVPAVPSEVSADVAAATAVVTAVTDATEDAANAVPAQSAVPTAPAGCWFVDSGIRKAILLVRFADFTTQYIKDFNASVPLFNARRKELLAKKSGTSAASKATAKKPRGRRGKKSAATAEVPATPVTNAEEGVLSYLPEDEERAKRLWNFVLYFADEFNALNDRSLVQEWEILHTLMQLEPADLVSKLVKVPLLPLLSDATAVEAGESEESSALEAEPATIGHKRKHSEVGDTTCVMCWDKDVSVQFLPCQHLVSCGTCAEKVQQCPMCRKNIA